MNYARRIKPLGFSNFMQKHSPSTEKVNSLFDTPLSDLEIFDVAVGVIEENQGIYAQEEQAVERRSAIDSSFPTYTANTVPGEWLEEDF